LPEPSTQLYPEDLKFGSYQVGYKTLWTYDITRPAIPYSDWNGKLYPTKESTGRQFQINVWYPAASITKAQRLTIGDYMKLIFRQIDFEESSESIDFGKKELITKLIDLGSFDSLSALDLMKLENLTSKSYHDATQFKGQFPLILYPNGMAPFTNSIGAEYLSSHGFVVIGFTPKGQNKLTKDISTRGADVVSDDIKFVLSEVLQLPYVDAENIGIIANAVESSFSVGYQAQNRTLKSIVSLEGGFLSNFEQNILKDLPFYEPQNIDIPILAIYSPHPSIDPKYIKHLKYSKRHLAHFQDMREYDYLNFGMYNNLVANIIGEPKGDVSASYVKAHKLIKGFFEHTLTKQAPNFDLYFTTMEPTVSDSTYIWESIPSMPDLSIVKNNFINEGFSYIDSLYKAHKTYTKQPFSKNFINDFRIWVSWKKDAKYTARKNLYKMAIESYPKSAKMSFYLAHYSLKAGDSTFALRNFKQTLKKLKTDTDVDLTIEYREIIKQRSSSQINILEK
jgi:hypothetical protein